MKLHALMVALMMSFVSLGAALSACGRESDTQTTPTPPIGEVIETVPRDPPTPTSTASTPPVPSQPSRPLSPAPPRPAPGASDAVSALYAADRDLEPDVPESELTQLVNGNTAFAFNLYRQIDEAEGNLLFSPHSISTALGMTYAGARGETESQMAQTLHFTLPQDRLHPAFNALDLALSSRTNPGPGRIGFQLNLVNSLWAQHDYELLQNYLDLVSMHYGSGIRPVDFVEGHEESRLRINDWISDQTEDRIENLIPQGVLNDFTRLVLVNAVYFNAPWEVAFDEAATAPHPFHLLDGSEADVPMMYESRKLRYARVDLFQLLDLPYEGGMYMTIILPDPGKLQQVESSLDSDSLNAAFEAMQLREVDLTMPKFEFDSQFRLKDSLAQMGMPDGFDPAHADLSGMDGRSCADGDNPCLFISAAIHRAFVKVDEAGTEAAASTAIVVTQTSAPSEPPPPPIEFTVDRPFIFLIRDTDRLTSAILFIGRVVDPR